MTPEMIHLLQTSEGLAALEAARTSRSTPLLPRVGALGRAFTPELARAALALDTLRVRAADKVPNADTWWLDADALEQGTAWPVALDRATRWSREDGALLTDLTAGLGFDALAAASVGWHVRAVERDPGRAALLRANSRALGVEDRVEVVVGDLHEVSPEGDHAYLDPDRRPGGKRTREAEAFEPPASSWGGLLAAYKTACVKAPPHGKDNNPDSVPSTVVSLRGKLRERRLHYGDWGAIAARRALVLPQGLLLEGPGIAAPGPVTTLEPGGVLVAPDAAVSVAGLVGDLAWRENLQPVHRGAPYLVGEAAQNIPGHVFQFDAVLPLKRAAIQRWLDHHGVGTLELRTQGMDRPVTWWEKRLRTKGPARGTLIFTKGPDERLVALAGLRAGPAEAS